MWCNCISGSQILLPKSYFQFGLVLKINIWQLTLPLKERYCEGSRNDRFHADLGNSKGFRSSLARVTALLSCNVPRNTVGFHQPTKQRHQVWVSEDPLLPTKLDRGQLPSRPGAHRLKVISLRLSLFCQAPFASVQDQHPHTKFPPTSILMLHFDMPLGQKVPCSAQTQRFCKNNPKFPSGPSRETPLKWASHRVSKWNFQRPNLWRTGPLEPRCVPNFKLPLGQRGEMQVDSLTHGAQPPHAARVIQTLGFKDEKQVSTSAPKPRGEKDRRVVRG